MILVKEEWGWGSIKRYLTNRSIRILLAVSLRISRVSGWPVQLKELSKETSVQYDSY
jgi:hypothetical protein